MQVTLLHILPLKYPASWNQVGINSDYLIVELPDKMLGNEIPIKQIPEFFDIFDPGIPVVDAIGVFPHVAGKPRLLFLFQRSFCLAHGFDCKIAIRFY